MYEKRARAWRFRPRRLGRRNRQALDPQTVGWLCSPALIGVTGRARWLAILIACAVTVVLVQTAAADSLLYRCGANVCRVAPDGTGRTQLTTDGRAGGPAYTWLSATRSGSRLAVVEGIIGVCPRRRRPSRQRTAATQWRLCWLPRSPRTAPRSRRSSCSARLTPPPFMAPPGSPPTLGLHPYLFLAAADGQGRGVVARDVVDAAWIGPRLLRSDRSSQAPFGRGLCLLAVNTGFACERDLARDPANDLSAPAISPDGRLIAVARSPAAQDAGTGPIVLYDTATGQFSRELTTGAGDGFPAFSPDSRRVAFNRGNDIYVTAVDGRPGSERRIVSGGLQPQWVSAGAACHAQRLVRPSVRGRNVTVRACAPAAGRLTVMLTRHGRPVARRTVRVRQGGIVTIHFARPSRDGPLSATVTFRAA